MISLTIKIAVNLEFKYTWLKITKDYQLRIDIRINRNKKVKA